MDEKRPEDAVKMICPGCKREFLRRADRKQKCGWCGEELKTEWQLQKLWGEKKGQ